MLLGRKNGGGRCDNSSGKQSETVCSFRLAESEALQVECHYKLMSTLCLCKVVPDKVKNLPKVKKVAHERK